MTTTESRHLLNEAPLLVMPTLASMIGLNKAIVVQQLHYWVKSSKHQHMGRYWVYNTVEAWQKQFPFWSLRTVRRVLDDLEGDGVIITGNFNPSKMDHTKWYTLDYDRLNDQNGTNPDRDPDLPLPVDDVDNLTSPTSGQPDLFDVAELATSLLNRDYVTETNAEISNVPEARAGARNPVPRVVIVQAPTAPPGTAKPSPGKGQSLAPIAEAFTALGLKAKFIGNREIAAAHLLLSSEEPADVAGCWFDIEQGTYGDPFARANLSFVYLSGNNRVANWRRQKTNGTVNHSNGTGTNRQNGGAANGTASQQRNETSGPGRVTGPVRYESDAGTEYAKLYRQRVLRQSDASDLREANADDSGPGTGA